MATKDDFTKAVLQLQDIHTSEVQALQEKLNNQISVNKQQEQTLTNHEGTIQRLQEAVTAAKKKIREQAAVISEQCIILSTHGHLQAFSKQPVTSAGHPQAFSNSKQPVTSSTEFGTKHGDQTVLNQEQEDMESQATELELECKDDRKSSKSTSAELELECKDVNSRYTKSKFLELECKKLECKDDNGSSKSTSVGVCSPSALPSPTMLTSLRGPQHVFYTYTKTVCETPQTSSNRGEHKSPAMPLPPPLVTDTVLKKEHSRSPEGAESSPVSPSLLALPGKSGSASSDGGGGGGGEEEDENPMSCSMFATGPCSISILGGDLDTSLTKATSPDVSSPNSTSRTPRRHGLLVEQIASKLVVAKESPTRKSFDINITNIVPVTPGIRSVENILSSGQWMMGGASESSKCQTEVMGKEAGKKRVVGKEGKWSGKEAGRKGVVEKEGGKRVVEKERRKMGAAEKKEEGKEVGKEVGKTGVTGKNRKEVVGGGGGRNKMSRTKRLATAEGELGKHHYHKRGYNIPSADARSNPRKRSGSSAWSSAGKRQREQVEADSLADSEPQDLGKNEENSDAQRLARKKGLPTNYKYDQKILKTAERDRLDAKACPDCQRWYESGGGVRGDQRAHLKHTCRHKALHLPPDSDPRMWDISFPATEGLTNHH